MKRMVRILTEVALLATLGMGCGQVKDTDADTTQVVTESETAEADTGGSVEQGTIALDAAAITGTWTLDMDACEKNLQNNGSMQELFGTGLQWGYALNLNEDNTMDYYIAIGIGGSGTYQIEDDNILATVKPYTEGEEQPDETIILTPVEIDGVLHLTMPCYEETMYWVKAEDEITAPDDTSENTNAKDSNYNVVPCTLDNPSWEYYLAGDGVDTSLKVPVLEERSKSVAIIGEEDKWFSKNELEQFSFPYTDENFTYNASGDFSYEPYILDIHEASTGALLYTYDFSNYRYADEYVKEDYDYICERICWAKARDQVLYVAIAHNTYAASAPHTGYLVAIDMTTNEVIWKTAPITSNSWSCALVDGGIICGYGFTDEKDYLNVVDIKNGTITQQIPLKTMAEYICEKDNQIYVITYNMEYVFDIKR